MAISPDQHPLPSDLEQIAIQAFAKRTRFPMDNPAVFQSVDTLIDDEPCTTLVFSAVFNQVRRFAVLVVHKAMPSKAVIYAGQTAASMLNSRLRREIARNQRILT